MATKHYYMDARELPEPKRVQAIFKRFDQLEPGEILIVHDNHHVRNLENRLRLDRANQYEFESLGESYINWLAIITKKNSAHSS